MENCCESNGGYKFRKIFGSLSLFSAASAALMAGVGCLGCLPFIGAIIATTGIASALDDHMIAVQLVLIGSSVIFSLFYFKKRSFGITAIVFAACSYCVLILNAIFLESRLVGILTTLMLTGSHLMTVRTKKIGPSLKLIFFPDCPNYLILKTILLNQGIRNFEEINSEKLPKGHHFSGYSSPSLVLGRKVLLGSKVSDGTLSCTMITVDIMKAAVKTLIPTEITIEQ